MFNSKYEQKQFNELVKILYNQEREFKNKELSDREFIESIELTAKVIMLYLKEESEAYLLLKENPKKFDEIGDVLFKKDKELHGWYYTLLNDIREGANK